MTWALLGVALLVTALLAMLAVVIRAARAALRRERAARTAQAERLDSLQKLAARNAAILQSAMDGFFVLGEDYRFQEVNDAFCRMIGYSAADLLQMKMTDLEVSAPVPDGGNTAYWRTGLHHFATAHRHKDGHIIQLESCVIVLRDGPAKMLVGFARDVTERCRAEQALRASETQYRNLVETSRDLIWAVDLAGRWTFVNNAARAIYGYEPEEMLGRAMTDFVAPQLVEATLRSLEELRAGRPRLRRQMEHRRKDGQPIHLSVNAVPVLDEYGNVVGATGTAADISDRIAAEERLRAAHARFESLVAGMPLGYIVWSTDFRVLEWNPAASAIFGYSPEEALGRPAIELIVPEEGRGAYEQMCRALLNGETSAAAVFVNRKHNGEKIRCEWYNTVLPDLGNGVRGVATLVRDVSERERLEAQLRQSQKLESLGVLAGGVAHDFNNLLVGIMGNASLAMEQLPANAPVQRLLEKVVNASRRATDLTQRMLAYAGRATCDVQIMDLNALVREMADFATAGLPKNVTLHMHPQPGLPLIKADSGQVQQVIMNLLINAAEAIGEGGGSVTVSTWTEELDADRITTEFAEHRLTPGRYVGLEVRDTGCGMAPDILGRIFDPFFTTKFAGRGLGLSAILGIVRAHHGAVTVMSEVGVGTVFRVLLPAVVGRPSQVTAENKGNGLPRGSTVLVIDDEEDIRDVVQAVLQSRGIGVLTAEDGRRGIELFKQHADAIDAVLLDMNMPGMSGEAVFSALLALRPDVKVILSTGYSEQEAALRFADAPLAGFVHKPYTATALVDKIGSAISPS
jgi:two-component system, cell cycle sensor histidine kinase and response regulator CckA